MKQWSDDADPDADLADRVVDAIDREDHRLATSLAEQLVARSPSAALFTFLGSCYMDEKRWDVAEGAFRDALAIEPNNALAHAGLGEVCRYTARFADAEEHLARAAERDPAAYRFILLGDVQLELERRADAERSFRRAVALDPTHEEAIVGLVCSIRYADSAEPIALLRDGLRHRRDEAILHRELGYEYLCAPGAGDARAELERAAALEPGDAWTQLYLSVYWLGAGDAARALTSARIASGMRPRWYMLGWYGELLATIEAGGRPAAPGARELPFDPPEVEGALHLAYALRKVGQGELASVLVEAARAVAPGHALLRLVAG